MVRSRIVRRAPALVLAVGAGFLSSFSAPADAEEPASAIAAAAEGMHAALQRGDGRTLAGFYTEDAELVGSPSLRGREAIERHIEEMTAKGVSGVHLEEQEVFPGEGYAVHTGRALFFDERGTRLAVLRFMTLWKKTARGWKIHRDIAVPVAVDAAALDRRSAPGKGLAVK